MASSPAGHDRHRVAHTQTCPPCSSWVSSTRQARPEGPFKRRSPQIRAIGRSLRLQESHTPSSSEHGTSTRPTMASSTRTRAPFCSTMPVGRGGGVTPAGMGVRTLCGDCHRARVDACDQRQRRPACPGSPCSQPSVRTDPTAVDQEVRTTASSPRRRPMTSTPRRRSGATRDEHVEVLLRRRGGATGPLRVERSSCRVAGSRAATERGYERSRSAVEPRTTGRSSVPWSCDAR